MKKTLFAIGTAVVLMMSGCASHGMYTQQDVGQVTMVKNGTVVNVRNVTVADDGKGSLGGAIVGGLAGSAFGKGDGKTAAVIAGALLGSSAGSSLNENAGQELTIRLDNGDEIVTLHRIEPKAPMMFRSGDRVRVELLNGQIRSIMMR